MADAAAIETVALEDVRRRPGGALRPRPSRRAREVFGYLGSDGAGKNTTIRLLLDLIRTTDVAPSHGGFSAAVRVAFLVVLALASLALAVPLFDRRDIAV
jgi:hypothetical protein